MNLIRKLVQFDPIVSELLKAGFNTYKKHIKAYLLINVFFITFFVIIFGLPTTGIPDMQLLNNFILLIDSYQAYTQTIFFYGVIGLFITIVTYYITFNQTLSSGELGLEIDTPWTKITQFAVILLYNMVVLAYLLIWAMFFKILFALVTFNSMKNTIIESNYTIIFFEFFAIIIILIIFFLFVVKFTYFIYILDELKVPTQALDPIIFIYGLLFGILILILDLITLVMPNFIEIAVIITYLTPGSIIMPILGYSMAHLKVASTVLGFEPLMVHDDALAS